MLAMLKVARSDSAALSNELGAVPDFACVSPYWLLDTSIPIEVRFGIQLIVELGLAKTARAKGQWKNYGATPLAVETTYDELIALTAWNRDRWCKILTAAKELGFLKIAGTPRGGFIYHVLFAPRTYVPAGGLESFYGQLGALGTSDGPTAVPSLFVAANRRVKKKPKRRVQLALGESQSGPAPGLKSDPTGGPLIPGAGLKKQRDADPLVPEAGIKRARVSMRLSPGPGTDGVTLVPVAGRKTSSLNPASGRKAGETKERACASQRVVSEDNDRGVDLGDVPEALRNELLSLEKRNDPGVTLTTATFVAAIEEVLSRAQDRFGDRESAIAFLGRFVSNDRRLRSRTMMNPIGWLVKQAQIGALFEVRAVPDDPWVVFERLSATVKVELLEAVATRSASLRWCKERGIAGVAVTYAKGLLDSDSEALGRYRSKLEEERS